MSTRLSLPNRRNHTTQEVKVAGQRTLYFSVHDDAHPALIGLYAVVARPMSLTLLYDAPA
jgi:hypothetical protein